MAAMMKEQSPRPPKLPRLPPFKNDEDPERYLSRFEKQMTKQDIPSEDYLAHLRPLLTGEALIACEAVPSEQCNCYMTVKASILTRFGVDQKEFRRRWWNSNRKPEETCGQFGNRVRDLGLKYIEGCSLPLMSWKRSLQTSSSTLSVSMLCKGKET